MELNVLIRDQPRRTDARGQLVAPVRVGAGLDRRHLRDLFRLPGNPGGAGGDRFGRKGVLLAGLMLFAVGALMSAIAPNVSLLLTSRAVAGVIGVAVLVLGALVLLQSLLSRRGQPHPGPA